MEERKKEGRKEASDTNIVQGGLFGEKKYNNNNINNNNNGWIGGL